ncbi:MAG: phage tail tip lysozyme [Oscillospiraceae bacterium]|nr:phage tail tip lysozyme [Oscillospiraceae bacterium]
MIRIGKRLLAAALAASLLTGTASLALARESAAEDETEAAWYTPYVTYLDELGYLDSLPEGTLALELTATRAVVVELLADLANVDLTDEQYQTVAFSDVPTDFWYTAAISWAVQSGIATGLTDEVFGPNVGVTKEEMAVMMYRYLTNCGVTLSSSEDATASFADQEQVSDWAVEAVDALRNAGILLGDENSCLAPQDYVTNAEAVVLLYRLVQQLEEVSNGAALVSLARAELELYGDGQNNGDYYQSWTGTSQENWSCVFVYWCADQVGLTGRNTTFGTVLTSVTEAWSYFEALGQTSLRGEGYLPQTGDLIFYYSEQAGELIQVGIVERYDVQTGTVYTIEGCAKNGCLGTHAFHWEPDDPEAAYPNRGTYIYGFASPDYGYQAGAAVLTGTDAYAVADYIYDTLLANGYTTEAACGILGNIYQECRFEYDIDNDAGVGLCQWIGVRKDNLLAYCAENGYDYRTLDGQLAFLINVDLENQDYYFRLYGGIAASDYKYLTDTETAAMLFYRCFERPLTVVATTRTSIALQFYDRYVNGYTGSIGDLG